MFSSLRQEGAGQPATDDSDGEARTPVGREEPEGITYQRLGVDLELKDTDEHLSFQTSRIHRIENLHLCPHLKVSRSPGRGRRGKMYTFPRRSAQAAVMLEDVRASVVTRFPEGRPEEYQDKLCGRRACRPAFGIRRKEAHGRRPLEHMFKISILPWFRAFVTVSGAAFPRVNAMDLCGDCRNSGSGRWLHIRAT